MKSILIVDDEPDILEILSYNLRKAGYNVSVASNGTDGLKFAHQHRPDLFILDIRMMGMSGIQMCSSIKQDEALKNIPVLFLTADQDELTAFAASLAGGEHYITKPLRPAIIVGIVNDIIH